MIAPILRRKRTYAILLIIFLAVLFYSTDWLGRVMYPIAHEELIRSSAKSEEVDPLLIAAIIRVESNYIPDKVSKKGAIGLMQVMPSTADWVAESAGYEGSIVQRLTEPELNVEIGTRYVRILMNQYAEQLAQRSEAEDRIALIAAAYNAGPGSVSGWLADKKWSGTYEAVQSIPYGETRHFVQRIIYYYHKYEQYYPPGESPV